MSHEPGSAGANGFPSTHWSLVGRAGDPAGGEARRQALSSLLHRYLPALRAHLLARQWMCPHTAEDLLQSFVASRILEKNILSQAEPTRGRFRSFLCTALDNFVANCFRNGRAQRRSPGTLTSLDAVQAPAPTDPDPYVLAWARTLLSQVLDEMKAECLNAGRADVWEVFDGRLLSPILDGATPMPYEELVRRFHLQSPRQAANLLITAKRAFDRILRAVVGQYVLDKADVEQEIADLIRILSTQRIGRPFPV
jgi:DNA-directed RNA polymerase specialized sigma24 family protein